MTDPIDTARDDLAFLRNVVDQGGRAGTTGGALFLAGGVLYGLQCLWHWIDLKGLPDAPPLVDLLAVTLPTAIFLVIMTVVMIQDRKAVATGGAARGLQATFAGIGFANLAMLIVFGVNAATHPEFPVWLFYPAVIFALQGAAWFVVWRLRKRGWLGLVAMGWFVAAVALGLSIDSIERYILVAAGALFLLMALPGAVMLRLSKQAA